MLKELLQIGFLTGSQAFGTAREDSDFDIVISIEDSGRVNDIIGDVEKVPSDYFSGYCISDGNKTINIIPVHPHEFLCWYLATKAMKATLKESGISDPIRKYAVFMGIVSLYKGTVEQRGTLSEYATLKRDVITDKYWLE
jgi:hypothetical protein